MGYLFPHYVLILIIHAENETVCLGSDSNRILELRQ